MRVHPSTTRQGRLSRRSLQQRGLFHRLLASLFFTLDLGYSLLRLPDERRRYDLVIYVRYLLGSAYLPAGVGRVAYRLGEWFLPEPEVRLFVDCSPEEALRRIAQRGDEREMFETLESLRAIRAACLRSLTPGWLRIDNTLPGRPPLEPVYDAIYHAHEASEAP